MRTHIKMLLVFLLAGAVFAQTSLTPPPAGKAVIYIYFDPGGMSSQIDRVRLSINGNVVLDDPATECELPKCSWPIMYPRYWQDFGQAPQMSYFDPTLGTMQNAGSKRVCLNGGDIVLDQTSAVRVGYARYEIDPSATLIVNLEELDSGQRKIFTGQEGVATIGRTEIVRERYNIVQEFAPCRLLLGQWVIGNVNCSGIHQGCVHTDANKTYYVKWSFNGLRLMREKDGEKDMRKPRLDCVWKRFNERCRPVETLGKP